MLNDIFGAPAVAAAARKLYAAAEAHMRAHAKERLEEFLEDAARSESDFDAAFLATQMLRDLERIDDVEALYVLHELIEKARGKGPSAKLSTADLYRRRGEPGYARLIERDLIIYQANTSAGHSSFMHDKVDSTTRDGIDDPQDLAAVSRLTEELMAAPAEDRPAEWNRFVRSLRLISLEGAVQVVRSLRDTWKLSPSDYANLIDTVIGESVDALVEEDAEIRRSGARAGVAAKKPKKQFTGSPDKERRSLRRAARIKAALLRRLGEHELANLLVSDFDAYDALIFESGKTRAVNYEQSLASTRSWISE